MLRFSDLIKIDLEGARWALARNDEAGVSFAAYHCQQAAEKTLAYAVQHSGNKTIKSHDIEVWLEYVEDCGIAVPELLITRAQKISGWASNPRYNINFKESRRIVLEVIETLEKWLEDLVTKRTKAEVSKNIKDMSLFGDQD
jgi:HEPN domain-containing protein